MSFNHGSGLFTASFDLVANRQAGEDIRRGDMQALLTELGDAIEAVFGRPLATVINYAAAQSYIAPVGVNLLLVQGGETQFDGIGGVYVRTTDTVQPHSPPTWLVGQDTVRWRRISPIVQATNIDTTIGALLRAGAYGLGGNLPAAANLAVVNDSIAPSFYSYDTASGSTGGPAGVSRGMVLHTRRGAGAGESQLMLVELSTTDSFPAGSLVARSRTGGAWGTWSNPARLGGALRDIGDVSVLDNTILPETYTYDTALGSVGGPAHVTKGVLKHHRTSSNGHEIQELVIAASSEFPAGAIVRRTRAGGAWSTWFPERVTNANGTYQKHEDGTLECWRDIAAENVTEATSAGGLSRTADITKDFAHAFLAGGPFVATVDPANEAFTNGFIVQGGHNGTQWSYRFARPTAFAAATLSPKLRLYARGRWA